MFAAIMSMGSFSKLVRPSWLVAVLAYLVALGGWASHKVRELPRLNNRPLVVVFDVGVPLASCNSIRVHVGAPHVVGAAIRCFASAPTDQCFFFVYLVENRLLHSTR